MYLSNCESKLHNKINSIISLLTEHNNCDTNVISNPSAITMNITRNCSINIHDPELIQAAGTGDLQRVFSLLYCEEVDPNIQNNSGLTPLLQATLDTQENLSIVELLIDRGADVNTTTPDGLTALIIASIKGYKNIVTALINAGADIRRKDIFGYTATALAARLGHTDIEEILNNNHKIKLSTLKHQRP